MNYGVASENIFPINVLKIPTIPTPSSISLISLKLIIIKENHIFRLADRRFGVIFNLFI